MDSTEIEQPIIVETSAVNCDGGGGAAGHPNVYLNMAVKVRWCAPIAAAALFLLKAQPVDRVTS